MRKKEALNKIRSELQEGMKLAKCQTCTCMKEPLENLKASLNHVKGYSTFIEDIDNLLSQMEPIKHDCLGCEYCFPAVATNIFGEAFPSLSLDALSCAFEITDTWPPVVGEYFAFCEGSTCPVAVSTLASVELAEKLAKARPKGLCIVGKTETENIGIDKVIKNTITNPTIRFLIVAGQDPKGHHSGRTLLALKENGVDEKMKVVGSSGKHPILKNVTRDEVEVFRKQVQVINMVGCEDIKIITRRVREVAKNMSPPHNEPLEPPPISVIPKIRAEEPRNVEMDKAGYFVIIPSQEKKSITAEHYSYDNELLHIIEGEDASSIYLTIIGNGCVTQLSHAAYLGKELAKAELSLRHGLRYIQDKAPGRIRASRTEK